MTKRQWWSRILRLACLLPCGWALADGGTQAQVAGNALAGPIRLQVDASDPVQRVLRVREEIPASPGPLLLRHPEWLPGKHAPRGTIDKLAGLVIRANGQPLRWRRDAVDVRAFHVDVPAGADRIVVEFEHLAPLAPGQGRVTMTADLLNLQWEAVALYPAGIAVRDIPVAASVKLPQGWSHAGALEPAPGHVPNRAAADGTAAFATVSFETLVDSPLFAGRHFRQVELGRDGGAPVRLNLFADEARNLEATQEQLALHANLVTQARRLFGARHFDRYDFLLALTDQLGGIGLEHHRSSENTRAPGYFTDWKQQAHARTLLGHEYVHSWNGKYRRPSGLATPDFHEPMRGDLLWIYEGLTEYWGQVLTARAQLWTPEQARESLAETLGTYADARPGFAWRGIDDTTRDPVVAARRPLPYRSWQMSEEYYGGGMLVWLATDLKLRELSRDRRSLDDFARAFFGGRDGNAEVVPYEFDDVVAALDAIAPHDWAGFLQERVQAHAAPLDALAGSGWKLVHAEQPSGFRKLAEAARKRADFAASIGLVLGKDDGAIEDVHRGGPAFRAGIAPGGTLLAVNGRAYSLRRLQDAVSAAKAASSPIDLLVRNGDVFRTVRIDYRGGLRYPRLERVAATRDRLGDIFASK